MKALYDFFNKRENEGDGVVNKKKLFGDRIRKTCSPNLRLPSSVPDNRHVALSHLTRNLCNRP
jgi:hypothetical protein